jgi:hypothetical protein
MVGIRKVQVCDRPVGILQHLADRPAIALGAYPYESGQVLFMRLSALPLIIWPFPASALPPYFPPSCLPSGATRKRLSPSPAFRAAP